MDYKTILIISDYPDPYQPFYPRQLFILQVEPLDRQSTLSRPFEQGLLRLNLFMTRNLLESRKDLGTVLHQRNRGDFLIDVDIPLDFEFPHIVCGVCPLSYRLFLALG